MGIFFLVFLEELVCPARFTGSQKKSDDSNDGRARQVSVLIAVCGRTGRTRLGTPHGSSGAKSFVERASINVKGGMHA